MRTNVMRLLEGAGIAYTPLTFDAPPEDLSGEGAAQALGIPPAATYKTLVLRGDRRGVFVCCVPVDAEIDLRKAARASGNKRAEMLPLRELTAQTGYVRGGCSPVGMRRMHPTFVHQAVQALVRVAVSAGARGAMVQLAPADLLSITGATLADLVQDDGA